jgi:hypothetical protein
MTGDRITGFSGTSESWNPGILESWKSLNYWITGLLDYWITGLLGYWTVIGGLCNSRFLISWFGRMESLRCGLMESVRVQSGC